MTFVRSFSWTLRVLSGFILFSGSVLAQDLPSKNSEAVSEASARLSKESRGIPPEELPKVKQQFLLFAKYYGDLISNPTFYKNSIDPKLGSAPTRTIPIMDRSNTIPSVLSDMDRFILEPNLNTKVNEEKIDYIREMGIAFDSVLKPLVESNSERIVRINAARLLAEVCRSGAAAHWPTITSLLNNANTAAEIKYYALQGAGNLLAAYKIQEYKFRSHSNGAKEVGALAQATTVCIENSGHLVPGFKQGESTKDQEAVVQFVRKQAIKALGQIRYASIPGPDGKQMMYPAYTLAQVCVSDPKLFPSPTPSECGEAVLGICNMSTSVFNSPFKGYNPAGVAEAVAAGLVTFATPRAEPGERTLAWRNYSYRLAEAFKNWRPLFDPVYDATQPGNFSAAAVPPIVNDLITRVQTLILAPIDKVDINGKADPNSAVNIEGMKDFLNQLRNNPTRNPLLFTDRPETVIYNPIKK